MDILDCPIKDLPSKGGRFSKLKSNLSRYQTSSTITLRSFYTGFISIYILTPGAKNELLQFLIDEERIKP